jgi:hypothetical protein
MKKATIRSEATAIAIKDAVFVRYITSLTSIGSKPETAFEVARRYTANAVGNGDK